MEIVLKILTLVLLVGVYILYYANIHGIVKLLSDNNKFKKISYVLAAINIAMQVYIDVAPVPRQVGSVISRMSELLIIITEWDEFKTLDYSKIHEMIKQKTIVDFRSILNPQEIEKLGFKYYYIGKDLSKV